MSQKRLSRSRSRPRLRIITHPKSPTISNNSGLFRLQPVDANTSILTVKITENYKFMWIKRLHASIPESCFTCQYHRNLHVSQTPPLSPVISPLPGTTLQSRLFIEAERLMIRELQANFFIVHIISKILEKIPATQFVNFLESKTCQVVHSTDSVQIYPR